MKAKDVHKLSIEEIDIEVKRLRRKLFEMKNQAVTEKIQDTSAHGKVKRDVARLLTERKIKGAAAAGA